MRRPLVLIAVLLAGLALNACGKADEPASEGETEAVYLDLDGLQYQVQISRQLNPYDVEDGYYVRGQREPPPGRDDTWFGVFVRVYNPTDTPKQATSEFEIHDTEGNIYKPVPLDNTNVFRYVPTSLGSEQMIPTPGSPGFNSPIRGSLLLFRVKIASFENRPLEFIIKQPGSDEHAQVPLDDTNVFRYVPTSLGSEKMIPTPGSPAFNSPIRGSLLLFRVKIDSFENRPLEFIIKQPGSTAHAQVPLDV